MTYLQMYGVIILGLAAYALFSNGSRNRLKILERTFHRCGLTVKEKDTEFYPVLVQKGRINGGWFYLYSPPEGIAGKNFIAKKDEIQDALHEEVEIYTERGLVYIYAYSGRPKNSTAEDWVQ
jgi:hypothetical protein